MARARELTPTIAGITITHPDRVVYPDAQLTKLDIARYYESVGDWIVPHVARRPLTLVLCPNGLSGDCTFMRHRAAWGATTLRRIKIQEKTKVGEYLVADDLPGVIALVQMTVLEIHTWNSRDDAIERPDRLVWDLDPGEDVTWPQVIAAAKQVREVLGVLGLRSWVKTTGGRGLHVVAPIARRRDWSECLAFARNVAMALERNQPNTYTTAFPKRGRESKLLIDYLRNNRTNTSIAAYSTRARPGAVVSMPVTWDELTPRLSPASFTVVTAPKRLATLKRDPWADYWTCRQQITGRVFRAVERLWK